MENTVYNGLANALNLSDNQLNLGTLYNNISPVLLSMQYRLLSDTYKSDGFARLAIDMPVSDAFRNGGFAIQSANLDPNEIEQIYQAMVENDDIRQIKDCLRWGLLYGGGALILNSSQKLDVPVNMESLHGTELEFIACDRWQLTPTAGYVRTSESFILSDVEKEESNVVIEKSHLKLFTGETPPYYIRNQLNGWGMSIFENVIPQLTQYVKANSVILELLDEAKIDILKIFGLSDLLLAPEGESAVRKRATLFATEKNFQNMGVMDTQDDYVQKQMTFAGLDRLLEKIFLLICSCLRLPYCKVFGRGANGFSSGEDDLENYNSMIMSNIRVPATPIIKWVAQIRACQLFGTLVDDLQIEWKPLRVLSDKEEQEIKNAKVENCIKLVSSRILTTKQAAEKLVSENVIELSEEELNLLDDTGEEPAYEPKAENSKGWKWWR